MLLGGALGAACGDWVDYPLVVGRCDPSSRSADECPEYFFCCSDDPAALGGDEGEPLFSRERNDRGRFGMCVRTDELRSEALAEPPGCPIPCNPRWEPSRIEEVCGASKECCQTVELHEDDCVFDDAEGRWRAADAREALGSLDGEHGWNPTPHSTHQDPDIEACEAFAGGDRGSDRFRECVGHLTTAAERGFCMALGSGQQCPAEDPEYVDACEVMNE